MTLHISHMHKFLVFILVLTGPKLKTQLGKNNVEIYLMSGIAKKLTFYGKLTSISVFFPKLSYVI